MIPHSVQFPNTAPMPTAHCVADLCKIAQTLPRQTALQSPGQPDLNYQQLADQINRLTRQLRGFGIQKTDRVAVALPNGLAMAVVFMGITAGAVCAPLNPNYRQAEFAFYLEDLQAKALILPKESDSPALAAAQTLGIPILTVNLQADPETGLFALQGNLPDHGASEPDFSGSDDVALILHTSGTTSRPKIVPLTHRNLLTSAQNIRETLQLTPDDGCLTVMPLFHIHGLVACLLSSLSAGSRVICPPKFEPDQFGTWLANYQPTWYSAVPTIHQQVLQQGEQGKISLPTSLRLIRSSSSPLPATVFHGLEQVLQVPVIEAYGMTEAAHQMTSNPLPPGLRKVRSVGIAAGPQVAIMNEAGQLLPAKTVGEVVIQGENVTLGYENNPIANGQAFTNGWFRTGDQGYFDEEGYLFLQGRLKEIINRGGEKIVPVEIDEALMALPGVHQGVAFAVPHPTLGEDVAAAVVLKPGETVSPETLRRALFEQLADFKVPSQILLVAEIPKGATGKLQRLSLAEKLADQLASLYVAPRDEIETAIADIICKILGEDQIGVNDNFFGIGGDSIKGTQVASRLASLYHLDLPNAMIFRHPTVVELAEKIRQLQSENSPDDEVADLINQMEGLSAAEIEQLLQSIENNG